MFTLDELKKDLETLIQRKEQALQGIHQILGGISIVEQLIQRLLKNEPIDNVPTMDSLEAQSGETNSEG